MNQCAHLHSKPTACSWFPRETLHRHDRADTETQTGHVGGSGQWRHWRIGDRGWAGSHLPGRTGQVALCQARKAESIFPKSRDTVWRTQRAGGQAGVPAHRSVAGGWRRGFSLQPLVAWEGLNQGVVIPQEVRRMNGEVAGQLPMGCPDPRGLGRDKARGERPHRDKVTDVGVEGDAVRS